MKRILQNQAGVTVLEGVIALGLLALITAGAFGVLLSASRQSSSPDVREDLSYTAENVSDLLKVYVGAQDGEPGYVHLPDDLKCGLCGRDAQNNCDSTPLAEGYHYVNCQLPPACDPNNDSVLRYQVRRNVSGAVLNEDAGRLNREQTQEPDVTAGELSLTGYQLKFFMRCNGYEL